MKKVIRNEYLQALMVRLHERATVYEQKTSYGKLEQLWKSYIVIIRILSKNFHRKRKKELLHLQSRCIRRSFEIRFLKLIIKCNFQVSYYAVDQKLPHVYFFKKYFMDTMVPNIPEMVRYYNNGFVLSQQSYRWWVIKILNLK